MLPRWPGTYLVLITIIKVYEYVKNKLTLEFKHYNKIYKLILYNTVVLYNTLEQCFWWTKFWWVDIKTNKNIMLGRYLINILGLGDLYIFIMFQSFNNELHIWKVCDCVKLYKNIIINKYCNHSNYLKLIQNIKITNN